MTREGRLSVSWNGVLDSKRRDVATAIGREVAVRISDPERLMAAVAAASSQTLFPESLRWQPYGVGEGDAGLALMCAYLDACMPHEGWDVTAHGFLTTAALGSERTHHLFPGIFGGLSGLAFATARLSRGGTRYRRLLATLDGALAPDASTLGEDLRLATEPGSVSRFDLISGASGVGAYLLDRDVHGVLPEILSGLVSLTEIADGVPRWQTPPLLMGNEAMAQMNPWGNLNCGLAHGIPGPLALLALALSAGVEVTGQVASVRRLAGWLVSHRVDDEWGVNWPAVVPLPAPGESDADPGEHRPARSAWCYGSPGVARALWFAGRALNDRSLEGLAVEAMHAVYRRPVSTREIDSPTFCHGVAGLLQITLRFANDTHLPAFADAAATLVDDLVAAYDSERPLGYASLEPGSNPVDRAGLLDGAAGVAMVLLAAGTEVEPTWDRLFLLS